MTNYLQFCVVEHTQYDEKIVHIENVSYDVANVLAEILNERYDSYYTAEDMEKEE